MAEVGIVSVIIVMSALCFFVVYKKTNNTPDPSKRDLRHTKRKLKEIEKKMRRIIADKGVEQDENHITLPIREQPLVSTSMYENAFPLISDPVPASTLKIGNQDYFRSTYSPFPPREVPFITNIKTNLFTPEWTRVGVLTPSDTSEDGLLNFYQRSVAPYIDLYEYAYEDKNGFFVPFPKSLSYVKDGDIIDDVLGKQALGPWKVNLVDKNEYIYM